MTAHALSSFDLPWSSDRFNDRRFRRILSFVGVVCLVAGTVVPVLDIPEIRWHKPVDKPLSRIKLVLERPKPVPLKPVVKPIQPCEPGELASVRLTGISRPNRLTRSRFCV